MNDAVVRKPVVQAVKEQLEHEDWKGPFGCANGYKSDLTTCFHFFPGPEEQDRVTISLKTIDEIL